MKEEDPIPRQLTTPRSAAIAGIIFSLMLGLILTLLRISITANPGQDGRWLTDPARGAWVDLAVNLVPFAGIAFLWFIGVLRDQIGLHEDKFFATVLLGSGLLFVAMMSVAGAIAGGLSGDASTPGVTATTGSHVWTVDVRITRLLLNIYAMRMAAVFMISVATIALRTRVMPRWLAISGYASAVVLLFSVSIAPWLELLFPLWVLLLSSQILRRSLASAPRS